MLTDSQLTQAVDFDGGSAMQEGSDSKCRMN
jgi:hypothetical protein